MEVEIGISLIIPAITALPTLVGLTAGGHFFLSNKATIPANNGAIMTSATKAKLAALYIMEREAVYIRIVLTEMGHKQPSTPLQTDNATAEAVCNGKIQPKRTKAMDMRFHWL